MIVWLQVDFRPPKLRYANESREIMLTQTQVLEILKSPFTLFKLLEIPRHWWIAYWRETEVYLDSSHRLIGSNVTDQRIQWSVSWHSGKSKGTVSWCGRGWCKADQAAAPQNRPKEAWDYQQKIQYMPQSLVAIVNTAVLCIYIHVYIKSPDTPAVMINV